MPCSLTAIRVILAGRMTWGELSLLTSKPHQLSRPQGSLISRPRVDISAAVPGRTPPAFRHGAPPGRHQSPGIEASRQAFVAKSGANTHLITKWNAAGPELEPEYYPRLCVLSRQGREAVLGARAWWSGHPEQVQVKGTLLAKEGPDGEEGGPMLTCGGRAGLVCCQGFPEAGLL